MLPEKPKQCGRKVWLQRPIGIPNIAIQQLAAEKLYRNIKFAPAVDLDVAPVGPGEPARISAITTIMLRAAASAICEVTPLPDPGLLPSSRSFAVSCSCRMACFQSSK